MDITTTLDNFLTALICPCYVCGRKKEFYACQRCTTNEEVAIATSHTQDDIYLKGFIAGNTIKRIEDLHVLIQSNSELLNRMNEATSRIQQMHDLRRQVDELRVKREICFEIKSIQKDEISSHENEKRKLESRIENVRKRIKHVKDKRSRIITYINNRKKRLSECLNQNDIRHELLTFHRQRHLKQLITDIFPIQEISDDVSDLPHSSDGLDDAVTSVSPLEEELAEARGLQFVHGRWYSGQAEGRETSQISITNEMSFLPGNGDYKLCQEWLKNIKLQQNSPGDMTHSTTAGATGAMLHRSSGAAMHSALSFTLQLLMVAKRLLDVHFPYNQHYKLLYDVDGRSFKSTVKRLNYNVMALCVLSKVDMSTRHPLHTLHNIKIAIDSILAQERSSSSDDEDDLCIDILTSIQSTLNDGSEPPSDTEDVAFENSPDFDAIDWDKIRSEDVTRGLGLQDVSEIRSQQAHEPFQSVTEDGAHGLMSSAVSWMTRGWWNK